MPRVAKRRLDEELVEQGFFSSVSDAQRAVMAGIVSAGGERLTKPGMPIKQGMPLHVKGSSRSSALGYGTYVSRGGLKLEGALKAFGISCAGLNCLDVGCSTGGFTDCMLKQGANRVASVDVGYGQFDWGLRGDSRVALFERTNICEATPGQLGAPFALAVADVSFTSVEAILPTVISMLSENGLFCTLVKPQFEAARDQVGEGGIVRDPEVHREVLRRVASGVRGMGMGVKSMCVSPIHGTKGNIEYFLLASKNGDEGDFDIDEIVRLAWEDVEKAIR